LRGRRTGAAVARIRKLALDSDELTDDSVTADKRRLLLDAAVRVFARKGFHAARVGDIAEEAGVAHGLLYHYFSSKDEVLATIFRETWTDLLGAVDDVEKSGEDAREQLRQVAAILLRSWRRNPDLVRVLVREVTRTAEVERRVGEIDAAFEALERIISRGQSAGQLREDLDPRLAAVVFYGALEEILTGWVLGQLPDGDDDIARAEQTVVEIVSGGLALGAPLPAG
jgi:TetR/AcrR family fatty acid metabolism transcriptional regulator